MNTPTHPTLWEKVQALTKGEISSLTIDGKMVQGPNNGQGFKIFPSAYANGWSSRIYKEFGGGWKSSRNSRNSTMITKKEASLLIKIGTLCEELQPDIYRVLQAAPSPKTQVYKALRQKRMHGKKYRPEVILYDDLQDWNENSSSMRGGELPEPLEEMLPYMKPGMVADIYVYENDPEGWGDLVMNVVVEIQ